RQIERVEVGPGAAAGRARGEAAVVLPDDPGVGDARVDLVLGDVVRRVQVDRVRPLGPGRPATEERGSERYDQRARPGPPPDRTPKHRTLLRPEACHRVYDKTWTPRAFLTRFSGCTCGLRRFCDTYWAQGTPSGDVPIRRRLAL